MNAQLESFITQLKLEGNSKVASIVKVAAAFKLGIEAAKKAVHESVAWSPEKAPHEEFQRNIADVVNELAPRLPTPDSERPSNDCG